MQFLKMFNRDMCCCRHTVSIC